MTHEARHIFVGALADMPMPEMLATIHRNRVPGVLEVQLGEFSKRVYILGGDIIFASSTNRGESLGDSLLASGQITVAQYRESALQLLGNPGKRHGQVLVEMGLLTEAEMRAAVLQQVQRIVWSLFDLNEGLVSFTLGEDRADEVYKLRIPTPRAVLHGCKTVADAKRLVARLGGKGSVFSRPPIPEHLSDFQLEAGEEELLNLVDGRRTLFDLCDQGPFSAGLNARVLYAFSCLTLIKKEKESASGIRVQVPSTE
ncbi:MAG TPA: DUF4388 domain-containing protein [Thermoanaerobaculaceae bacterium]|nr:DUF4388 domain-containing protein [Thermoanaerobaculaceae bacterium]